MHKTYKQEVSMDKETSICPFCGSDISLEIRTAAKKLLESFAYITSRKPNKDIATMSHIEVLQCLKKEIEYAEKLNEMMIVSSINLENIRQRQLLLFEEGITPGNRSLSSRKNTVNENSKEQWLKNAKKARKSRAEEREKLLSDVRTHQEYMEREKLHIEGRRSSSARKAFEHIQIKAIEFNCEKMFVYGTHGDYKYFPFKKIEDIPNCIMKYRRLYNRNLYVRKYVFGNVDFCCIYVLTTQNVLLNIAWVYNCDVTDMQEYFQPLEDIDKILDKERLIKLKRNLQENTDTDNNNQEKSMDDRLEKLRKCIELEL